MFFLSQISVIELFGKARWSKQNDQTMQYNQMTLKEYLIILLRKCSSFYRVRIWQMTLRSRHHYSMLRISPPPTVSYKAEHFPKLEIWFSQVWMCRLMKLGRVIGPWQLFAELSHLFHSNFELLSQPSCQNQTAIPAAIWLKGEKAAWQIPCWAVSSIRWSSLSPNACLCRFGRQYCFSSSIWVTYFYICLKYSLQETIINNIFPGKWVWSANWQGFL